MPFKFTGGTKYLLQFKKNGGSVCPDGAILKLYPHSAAQNDAHLMAVVTIDPTPAGGTGGLAQTVLLPGVQYDVVGTVGSGFTTQSFTTTANTVDALVVTSST